MTGILQAAGLSGVTLLVEAGIAWLAVRGTDALVRRAVTAQESELRQAEARWTSALGVYSAEIVDVGETPFA